MRRARRHKRSQEIEIDRDSLGRALLPQGPSKPQVLPTVLCDTITVTLHCHLSRAQSPRHNLTTLASIPEPSTLAQLDIILDDIHPNMIHESACDVHQTQTKELTSK